MILYSDIESRFRQLFDDNYRRLVFHALRFVENQTEAEDVVSDVFYELWKNLGNLDLDSGMTSYLYRAVATRALNVLRHRNVAAVRIELLESINERRMEFMADDDTQRRVESCEIGEKLREAIDELPDKCRQVFILSYINGLKNKDIAEAMNISVRTVEAQVYKALHTLRDKLRYLLVLIIIFLGYMNK